MIMNFLDTSNLDHELLKKNRLFLKYRMFMKESLFDRYKRICGNHIQSIEMSYLDSEIIAEENYERMDAKAHISKLLSEIILDISESLLKKSVLSKRDTSGSGDKGGNNTGKWDREQIALSFKELSNVHHLLRNNEYEKMKSEYYFLYEKFLYNTYIRIDDISTNVFSPSEIEMLMSRYQNILDITLVITNYETINKVMDFTINYVLDVDEQKFDKLYRFNQIYILLFEFISHHERNYERIVRYNRSRWPILPQLQKMYTSQFQHAYDIFILKNIGDEWKAFGTGRDTMFEPIAKAIDNLLNPKMILKSLL
jgi:hypothetical protein